MKRFVIVVVWLCSSVICMAQSKGEFQGLYQRISGFNSPKYFGIANENTNGGGYTLVYNLSENFGVFQAMGFFGGFSQNGFSVRLISEMQGFRISKANGPFELYTKGGIGISIFSLSGNLGSSSNFALNYGAGAEVKMTDSLYWVVDASRLTTRVPNFYDGSTGWDSSWILSSGIAIHWGQ